jgi:hypothetical protein
MKAKIFLFAAAVSVAPGLLHAQFDFKLVGRTVQMHSFAAQGFLYSNQNNYLTMKTSSGSFAMADGGANISAALTDHFRVGAQAYASNFGRPGNGQVQLDWAYGGYKFKRWFGVRAGKITTVLGLYNDTQDDVYGDISVGKGGSIAYTAYGGTRPYDARCDKAYVLGDDGIPVTGDITGRIAGGDLRWNTRLPGLAVAASYSNIEYEGSALHARTKTPLDFNTKTDSINAFYADFSKGPLHVNTEYRRNWELVGFMGPLKFPDSSSDQQSWYAAGAYRINRRLDVGTYRSQYVYDARKPSDPANNRIYDQTVMARFDLTEFWSVKVEGHLIDGYGAPQASNGVYPSDNPRG